MPVCEHCGRTLVCPGDGVPVHVDAEAPPKTTRVALPCEAKAGIWVKVGDGAKAVEKVKVEVDGLKGATDKRGLAEFDKLALKQSKYKVTISLSDELDVLYALPVAPSVERTVQAGQITFVPFELAPRAKPVIDMARDAVAVKGARLKITLKADRTFAGKGVLTCTGGADKLKLWKGSDEVAQPNATFENITEAGVELEAEAVAPTDELLGVELKWELDGGAKRAAPAVTRKLTVVAAVLDLYTKADAKLGDKDKTGDGLIVHLQNGKNERRRARATVTCKPAKYRGAFELAAIKANLAVYTKGGDKVDLGKPIDITSDDPIELLVEGTATSAAKADTGLTLKIKDLSGPDPVDSAKITVLETKIDLHDVRVPKPAPAPFSPQPPPSKVPPPREDPPLIPDDKKLTDGRTIFKQSAGFALQRAMVRVKKIPHDAPCKLVLRSPSVGNELLLFPDTGLHKTDAHSYENHTENEKATGAASMDIAATDITDAAAGMCFWIQGAKASGGGKVQLQIDVDGVDEACDAVAFTVAETSLTIKVVRSDGAKLAGDVGYDVKTRGSGTSVKTGTIPAGGSGEVTVGIEAGDYVVELSPTDVDEADMRLTRTEPATQEAAISVKGAGVAGYKLSPPYQEIQLVGFFIRSGPYIGLDDPARSTKGTPAEQLAEVLKEDMEARCLVMKEAIVFAETKATKDADTLKIFMAPEFYFRGMQGAYPLDMVSEVMNVKVLRDEIVKDVYKDWLFVLGSAIGSISVEGQARRADFDGTVTAVGTDCTIAASCDSSLGVAVGWAFWYFDKNSVLGWQTITGVTPTGTSGSNTLMELKLDAVIKCGEKAYMGVMAARVPPSPVTLATKEIFLEVRCPVKPKPGWTFKQKLVTGTVTGAGTRAVGVYIISVDVAAAETLGAGPARINDGIKDHAAKVEGVAGCRLTVTHPPGSPAAGAANGWDFFVADPSGQWSLRSSLSVDNATPVSPGTLQVEFDEIPVIPAGRALALANLPVNVNRTKADKKMTFDVDIAAGTVKKGQYLEEDSKARAVVESDKVKSGTTHEVEAWIPSGMDPLANGKTIKFVDLGETEIINIALVRRGGKEAPVRPDGGAGNDLLVYKEWISSVDFRGMDYGTQTFYKKDRHAAEIQSNQATRLLVTDGSRDGGTSPNVPGATEWTEPGGKKHTVPEITEKSGSGLGGGSVFTMDGITFGLEVCLDHGQKKLENYYGGLTAGCGHPMVQVQLIPSCGMSIDNHYCVADGLVFNVDATHVVAEADAGGTELTAATTDLIAPTPTKVDKLFDVSVPAIGTGKILTYPPQPVPTKGTV